jgi:uncharacterized protein (DUF433 family)
MAAGTITWSQCTPAERIPGKVSGAGGGLRDTGMPNAVILENLEYGSSIPEIIENHNVKREQMQALLAFAAAPISRE